VLDGAGARSETRSGGRSPSTPWRSRGPGERPGLLVGGSIGAIDAGRHLGAEQQLQGLLDRQRQATKDSFSVRESSAPYPEWPATPALHSLPPVLHRHHLASRLLVPFHHGSGRASGTIGRTVLRTVPLITWAAAAYQAITAQAIVTYPPQCVIVLCPLPSRPRPSST
jgi:hypothetical protein